MRKPRNFATSDLVHVVISCGERLCRTVLRKGSAFPGRSHYLFSWRGCASTVSVATISRDNPCLSITGVAHDRLPVFRTDAMKKIVCAALDEARHSGGFAIFAYVIMPDHFHLITHGALKPSDTLRFVNGITGHRVISYLKEKNYTTSLAKLRDAKKARGHAYSLWDGHSHVLPLFSESFFMQRVNYIHQNPVMPQSRAW
jgi:REP element-mobilizing transposase RayT